MQENGEALEQSGRYATPPRFQAAGGLATASIRPEFQAVKVKAPVGAKIDLLVVRGVRIKDVASGTESEPGILTLNNEHIRFKAAPNDAGDGYSMITYLDEIPLNPGPRCTGGTLGGFVKPFVIEVPRQRTGEDEERTRCHLIFGTEKVACNTFFEKLEGVLQAAAHITAAPLRGLLPNDSEPEPDPGPSSEPEPEPESPIQPISAASAATTVPAADPESLELIDTQKTDPAVTLYVVNCKFSDGSTNEFTKRFREFRKLRDEIVDLFPSAESWSFPAKHLIGSTDAHVIEARQLALQEWCNTLMCEGRHLGPAAWAVLTTFVQSRADGQQSDRDNFTTAELLPAGGQYPQDILAAFDAVFPLLPSQVTVEMLRRSGGGPLYEGFLYKEGRQLKKWNQRFFVLWPKEPHPQMGRILAYFDLNTKTHAYQVKGVIHVVKPVVRAPKTRRPEKFCMRLNANAILGTVSEELAVKNLVTENDKKYIIGTDDERQMEVWVQTLRQCGSADGGVLANPTEEGWLLIQETGLIRWWKKSWVQLHENALGDPTLVHYDSSVTWPKGTFNLNQYFVYFPSPTERAREYEIALLPRPPRGRTASEAELREKVAHFFCAEDQEQFQKWRAKLSVKGDEITEEVGEIRYRKFRQQRVETGSKYSPPVQVLSHRRPRNTSSDGATAAAAAGSTAQAETGGVAHLHDFDILNVLGEGAFGKVLLVRHRGEKKQYAMKMMLKADIVRGNKEAEVTKELETMISIEHPYIVQVHYAFHNPSRLFLVVDFMPGGELYHHLKQVKRFTEDQARFICAEISLALGYLHDEKDMAYRDLKPENVMFTSDGHIRLIDFGLVKWKASTAIRSTACGTPLYMTPEGVENFHALQESTSSSGVRVGKEADWYTLGTLLYELTVGDAPFQADEQYVLLNKIRSTPVEFYGPAAALSAEAKDVLMRLLEKNPNQRLGHWGQREIQEHAFFSSIEWDLLKQHRATPRYVPPSKMRERFPSAQLNKDAQKIEGIEDSSSPKDDRFAMWQFPRPQSVGQLSHSVANIVEEVELEQEDDDSQETPAKVAVGPEPAGSLDFEPEVLAESTIEEARRVVAHERNRELNGMLEDSQSERLGDGVHVEQLLVTAAEPEPEPEPKRETQADPTVERGSDTPPHACTTVANDGAEAMLLQPEEPSEETASHMPESCDVEIEFAENRIGILLTGVDDFGEDVEDGDERCRYVEVTDVVDGSPASQHPLVQPEMALKAIAGQSVLGLSTNATIERLRQADRPVKIVLGPVPAPLPRDEAVVSTVGEILLQPEQPESGEQPRTDTTPVRDGTPTPVIDSSWIEHYNPPPGAPQLELAEGIPPSLPRLPPLEPAPASEAQHNAVSKLQQTMDNDEELTPTLPTAILAAKAMAEHELEHKSKNKGHR